jgi:hypothetical protein
MLGCLDDRGWIMRRVGKQGSDEIKRQTYRGDSEQVPTRPTTILEIMASPEFALGVADARAGRPYRGAYQTWDTNRQWDYERGRAWSRVVPASVVLKRNGKITSEAVEWFQRRSKDIR